MVQNIVSGCPEYDFPNSNDRTLDELYEKCKCGHKWTQHDYVARCTMCKCKRLGLRPRDMIKYAGAK